MLFWKIPLGYYNVPDLLNEPISEEETIHMFTRTDFVRRWCGVTDQSRILAAIERLRLKKQYKNLKTKVIVGEEEL